MGNVFRFKQFEVDQEGCAMRINTDGVLLAAIATHANPHSILDVGTGTGVMALMLAQRFPDAKVDAVEIDEQASKAAAKNFKDSPYADRLAVFNADIAKFKTRGRYDMIISNPPFFVNDLKNAEGRKRLARHTDEDFFNSLLQKSDELLTDDGVMWLILPVKQADLIIAHCVVHNLALQQEISICSDVSKPVIRKIICLGRDRSVVNRSMFYIYEANAIYTADYKRLLKDFFLAF